MATEQDLTELAAHEQHASGSQPAGLGTVQDAWAAAEVEIRDETSRRSGGAPSHDPMLDAWIQGLKGSFHAAWAHASAITEPAKVFQDYAKFLTVSGKESMRRALAALSFEARHFTALATWHHGKNAFAAPRRAVEQVLVALQGHWDPRARRIGVRLLSCLVAGHLWEADAAMPVTVAVVGEPMQATVTVQPSTTAVPVLGDGEEFRFVVCAPRWEHDLTRGVPANRLSLHSPASVAVDATTGLARVTLDMGAFPRPGFFDWRLVVLSSTGMLRTATATSVDASARTPGRPAQGRFVVHHATARGERAQELRVDLVGLEFSPVTGAIRRHGTFDDIADRVASLRESGVTALHVSGAIERDAGWGETDAAVDAVREEAERARAVHPTASTVHDSASRARQRRQSVGSTGRQSDSGGGGGGAESPAVGLGWETDSVRSDSNGAAFADVDLLQAAAAAAAAASTSAGEPSGVSAILSASLSASSTAAVAGEDMGTAGGITSALLAPAAAVALGSDAQAKTHSALVADVLSSPRGGAALSSTAGVLPLAMPPSATAADPAADTMRQALQTVLNRHGERKLAARPDANPHAVTCRRSPSRMAGGAAGFEHLCRVGVETGVRVIVQCDSAVSASRPHRRYTRREHETETDGIEPPFAHTLDASGLRVPHRGTDGCLNMWEDQVLPNYRLLETWETLTEDLQSLALDFGVRGAHLTDAQSAPLVLEADSDELLRRDPDGGLHYTPVEILEGAAVVPNSEGGYWADRSLWERYPNPLVARLARDLWETCGDFALYGDCAWGREGPLVRSGMIPHALALPAALARTMGRDVTKTGRIVHRPPRPGRIEPPVAALQALLAREGATLPPGAEGIVVRSLTSSVLPYPALLLGRSTWPAIDVLHTLPGAVKLFGDETKGMAHRPAIAGTIPHDDSYVAEELRARESRLRRRRELREQEARLSALTLRGANAFGTAAQAGGMPARGAPSSGSSASLAHLGMVPGAPASPTPTDGTHSAASGSGGAVSSSVSMGRMRHSESSALLFAFEGHAGVGGVIPAPSGAGPGSHGIRPRTSATSADVPSPIAGLPPLPVDPTSWGATGGDFASQRPATAGGIMGHHHAPPLPGVPLGGVGAPPGSAAPGRGLLAARMGLGTSASASSPALASMGLAFASGGAAGDADPFSAAGGSGLGDLAAFDPLGIVTGVPGGIGAPTSAADNQTATLLALADPLASLAGGQDASLSTKSAFGAATPWGGGLTAPDEPAVDAGNDDGDDGLIVAIDPVTGRPYRRRRAASLTGMHRTDSMFDGDAAPATGPTPAPWEDVLDGPILSDKPTDGGPSVEVWASADASASRRRRGVASGSGSGDGGADPDAVLAESLRRLAATERAVRDSLGPHVGFDLALIDRHYRHRAIVRAALPALTRGSLIPLVASHRFGPHGHCIAYGRALGDTVVVVACNFNEHASTFAVDCRPLLAAFEGRASSRPATAASAPSSAPIADPFNVTDASVAPVAPDDPANPYPLRGGVWLVRDAFASPMPPIADERAIYEACLAEATGVTGDMEEHARLLQVAEDARRRWLATAPLVALLTSSEAAEAPIMTTLSPHKSLCWVFTRRASKRTTSFRSASGASSAGAVALSPASSESPSSLVSPKSPFSDAEPATGADAELRVASRDDMVWVCASSLLRLQSILRLKACGVGTAVDAPEGSPLWRLARAEESALLGRHSDTASPAEAGRPRWIAPWSMLSDNEVAAAARSNVVYATIAGAVASIARATTTETAAAAAPAAASAGGDDAIREAIAAPFSTHVVKTATRILRSALRVLVSHWQLRVVPAETASPSERVEIPPRGSASYAALFGADDRPPTEQVVHEASLRARGGPIAIVSDPLPPLGGSESTATTSGGRVVPSVAANVVRAVMWHAASTTAGVNPLLLLAALGRVARGMGRRSADAAVDSFVADLDQVVTAFAASALSRASLGGVVFAAPELGRWSTVGGLGVMVDELTIGLAQIGVPVTVISPYYHRDKRNRVDYLAADKIEYTGRNVTVRTGPHTTILGLHAGHVSGVRVVFLHNAEIFPKPYPNLDAEAQVKQLAVFAKGCLQALCDLGEQPSVVVTNDWFTGLIPAYAREGHFGRWFDSTDFLHICHNLDPSYEGRVYPGDKGSLEWLHELPRDKLVDPTWSDLVVNPTRCALLSSDSWATVSRSYRTDLLSSSPLAHILALAPHPFAHPNGIDMGARLKALRDLETTVNVRTHEEAKAFLQRKYFGFAEPDLSRPLFGFVGRVTAQKGVHLILNAVEPIMAHTGGRAMFLIGGMASMTDPYGYGCAMEMQRLRARYPDRVWADPSAFFTDGVIVNLGCDFCLMPSMFEPGGIVQHEFFVAQTPVVAFNTGGLKDSVVDYNASTMQGNGYKFYKYTLEDFCASIHRALAVFDSSVHYQRMRVNAGLSVMPLTTVSVAWFEEFCRIRRALPVPLPSPEAAEEEARVMVGSLIEGVGVDPYTAQPLRATPVTVRAADGVAVLTYCAELSPAPRKVAVVMSVPPSGSPGWFVTDALASVEVCGSWDSWKQRSKLSPGRIPGDDWSTTLNLSPGTYQYKLVVSRRGGVTEWCMDPRRPIATDAGGNSNNELIVRIETRPADRQERAALDAIAKARSHGIRERLRDAMAAADA